MSNKVYAIYNGERTELVANMSVYSDGQKYVVGEWDKGLYVDSETGEETPNVDRLLVYEAEMGTKVVYTWKEHMLLDGEEIHCDKPCEMESGFWEYPDDPETAIPHVPLEVGDTLDLNGFQPEVTNRSKTMFERQSEVIESSEKLTQAERIAVALDEEGDNDDDYIYNEEPVKKHSFESILDDVADEYEDEVSDDDDSYLEEAEAIIKRTAEVNAETVVDVEPASKTNRAAKVREAMEARRRRRRAYVPGNQQETMKEKLEKLRAYKNSDKTPEDLAKLRDTTPKNHSDARKHRIAELEARLKAAEDKIESFQSTSQVESKSESVKQPVSQPENSVGKAASVETPKSNLSGQEGLDALKLIQSLDMDTIVAIKSLKQQDILENASLIVAVLSLGQEQKDAIMTVANSMAAAA